MKIYTTITSCIVFLALISGCSSTPKPQSKEKVKIDPTLPVVTLTKRGVFADMNALAFEWQSVSDERVKGFYIYKQNVNKADSELTYYETISNRFATHYLDREIEPNQTYRYSFKTFSKDAESRMSKIKVVKSLPVLKSVIWIQSIGNMPRSAKIIWRPHINEKVKLYIIERKTPKDENFKEIATVEGRLSAEYIDTDLKDNYIYRYRVRVKTFDDIVSAPSKVVKVITKPLPKSINHITATTDLPKKIDISWEKSKEKDFDHYNLYRADSPDGSYKLIAKLYSNRYTDSVDADGKKYFYRVSAVEKNGLESIHEKLSIQGMTLIKPQKPTQVDAKLTDNKVIIQWSCDDPRVKSFIIVKKSKTGWFDTKTEEFRDIKTHRFIDTDIGPDTTYYYKIYSLDKYLILSKPSVELELKTPKNIKNNTKKTKAKTPETKNIKTDSKNKEVIIPLQDFN